MARRNIAPLSVVPLGDAAAYVEFSETLDLEVNSVVQRLGLVILKRSVPWVRDVVPALGGLALHFDPDHAEFPGKPLEAALALVVDSMKTALAAKDLGVMLYVLSNSKNFQIAKRAGIPVLGEVFADRGYSDDGTLAPRDKPGGMIEDPQASVKQVLGMIEEGYVTSLSGKRVPVAADTLCLHGDQPGAVTFAKKLRETFNQRGISVAAP